MRQTSGSRVFDRQQMLERLGGDEELLREVLDVFRDECPRMIATTRVAVHSGDASGVERAGHTLKGALLNISAAEAAAVARDLEHIGRSGALDGVAQALRGLESALERLDGELVASLAAAWVG